MSIHSDTSRSVREEAHQKLDALLYSISSRQLERVYGIHRDDNAEESTSAAPPALPPPRRTPTTENAQSQRPVKEKSGIRWKDDEESNYDVIGDSRAASFPPIEDFQKKLNEVKKSRKRAEDLARASASSLDFDDEQRQRSESDRLTPYVDALLNYVHFLESEKRDFAEEMNKLRRTVGVVTKENAHLHKEMKRGFLEAAVNAGNEREEVGKDDDDNAVALLEAEMKKMAKRHELEINRLRDRVESAENEKEELERAWKAAKKEATDDRSHIPVIEDDRERIVASLRRERDSLSEAVVEVARKLKDAKKREDEMADKLKKTILVADQSLFEKDEMALREEKVRRELEGERVRWEEEKLGKEEEWKAERQKTAWETGARVAALEEAVGAAEERAIALAEQLKIVERRKGQEENEKLKNDAKGEKDDAEKIKDPNENDDDRPFRLSGVDPLELNRRKQAEERLRQEIANYEEKTRTLERELAASREECVKLHERVAEVEREASLARLKRETMAKFRFDDAKETREDAERRIEEAKRTADAWRRKYGDDVDELKTLAARQSALISQLREECVALTSSLQSTSSQLESETVNRAAEAEKADNAISSKSEELRKEKQKNKKLGETVRKLKRDSTRLNAVVTEQKHQILEMNDMVARTIAERQMQAKENEFLRQIQLPSAPTRGTSDSLRYHQRSLSATSTGINRLLTPPLLVTIGPPTNATTAATTAKSIATSDQDVRLSASGEDEA